MFGIKILKEKDWTALREEMTVYQRQLEDIGWINMSTDPMAMNTTLIAEGFKNMLRRCKEVYYKSPLAGLWVHLTTNFVFGEGISTPKAQDEQIQEVINEFWDDEDNKIALTSFMAQHLLSNKMQYEGNLFFVFFDDPQGKCKLRILNVEEVDDIINDPDDRMRMNFYKVKDMSRSFDFNSNAWTIKPNQFVYYPSYNIYDLAQYNGPANRLKDDCRIMHHKINCDINDKFGVPDLYRSIDWIKAHTDMAGDLATLIKALSQYAWKKKIKGTASQVNAIASSMASKMNLSNLKNSAGQMQIENESVDLQSIDIKTGGAKIGSDGLRQMLLMVCAGSGIYEHYFGNPETGNLATAKSMELPMVKKFTTLQSLWSDIILAVLNYVIDRKIEVGELPGEIIDDVKNKRRIYKTDLDRTIDIDFPPILEQDLKAQAEAYQTAVTANLIPEETAAQQFMMDANINNIEEEMDKLKLEVAQKKKDAAALLTKVPMGPGGFNKSGQTDKSVKESVDEILDVSEAAANVSKRVAIRSQRKNNFMVQKMNSYRKEVNGNFRDMIKDVRKSLHIQEHSGTFVGHVPKIYDIIANFKNDMFASARKYYPIAIKIGETYMQKTLKDVKPELNLKETIYEAEGRADVVLNRRLNWNQHYLNDSLEPDIMAAYESAIRKPYATAAELKEAVDLSLLKFSSRVDQYVNALWTVEQDAVKEAGRGTDVMVNFIGPDDGHTCPGCDEGVNGSPWPINEAPIPGEQECMGNCRHALQVVA